MLSGSFAWSEKLLIPFLCDPGMPEVPDLATHLGCNGFKEGM